jgi:hypothetical protein
MGKIRVGGITIVTFKCVCGVTLDSDELHTRYNFNEIMTIISNHISHFQSIIDKDQQTIFEAIGEAHQARKDRNQHE